MAQSKTEKKMLADKAGGPEFRSPAPTQKARSSGKTETESLEFTGQSCCIGEVQVQ